MMNDVKWYLYIIQCTHTARIKIGYSYDPRTRIKAIRSCSPTEINVICLAMCNSKKVAMSYETLLHNDFAEERLHNEWFELSERLYDFIKDLINAKCRFRWSEVITYEELSDGGGCCGPGWEYEKQHHEEDENIVLSDDYTKFLLNLRKRLHHE